MAIWADLNGLNCPECHQQTKDLFGCEGPAKKVFIEGVEVAGCPGALITTQSRIYLQAYSYYQDGFLPGEGDAFDQSNKVMEAIRFIGREVTKMEKKS